MNYFHKILSLMVIINVTSAIAVYAQDQTTLTSDEKVEQLAATVEQLQLELKELKSQTEQEASKSVSSGFYTPQVYGALFATFATSGYDGATRFNVRNARFGVNGNAAKDLSYGLQVDFHNQGSVSVLDAYVKYKLSNFDISLGQQQIRLSTDMGRGPSSSILNSRSYATILSTAYYSVDEYGAYSTSSLGSRDIGVYTNYKFNGEVPITLSAGAFNGLGINKTEWSHRMNYVMRIMAGSSKQGLYGGASVYLGDNNLSQQINIYTAELSYKNSNLFLEALYQQRRLDYDGLQIMQLGLVQGYYKFYTPKSTMFSHVTPTLRWDWGDDLEYLNTLNSLLERYNVHRLTPQITIGLKGEKIRAHIAISYEKIMMSDTPSDLASNTLMQDKFTIGFAAAF